MGKKEPHAEIPQIPPHAGPVIQQLETLRIAVGNESEFDDLYQMIGELEARIHELSAARKRDLLADLADLPPRTSRSTS
ncbi:hypothetical protein [Actinoplanes awajinensis]|uniref:hypothetical protein n=1 Tax=Actinoplanes awajinensis TaxID=135946 RepID=UPI0012F862DB|nr:hypothetical protein [Actinoplanes awajinensis]